MVRRNEPEPDETDLMARLTTDEAAFEEVHRRYVRRVAAYAARRCPEEVADVVAQTVARVLRQADRYDPARGSVASFVFRLAGREVADLHRRSAANGS